MNLSKEEKELRDSIERGEWETIPDVKKEIERYREYADSTF